MYIRMLSLRCPILPVLSCVDFVEAIQDPKHLFKVLGPESQMIEVVIDVSSDLLTAFSAFVQLGSREARHWFVNRCKNIKTVSQGSISLNRGEQCKYNVEEFISNR